MNKKSIVFFICITALFLICQFTVCAEDTFVKIGSVMLTETTNDVFGDGSASYNRESNVLTLNGYRSNGAVYPFDGDKGAAIYSNGDITLRLTGENTVENDIPTSASFAIYIDGSLTIDGDGILNASSLQAVTESCGIYASKGIIVRSGTVSACSADIPSEISNGKSAGIIGNSGITVKGGILSGIGGEAPFRSYGVVADTVRVSGGRLYGEAKKSEFSIGIRSDGSIELTDGEIYGIGADASDNSYGIHITEADAKLTVDGGKAECRGGKDALITSSGIRMAGATDGVYLTGGAVLCSGDTYGFDGAKGPYLSRRGKITAIGGVQAYSTAMIFSHMPPTFLNPNYEITIGSNAENSVKLTNSSDISFKSKYIDITCAVIFADVPEDAWYAKSVKYCSDKSYMNGTGETEFSPSSPLTRAMLVQILAKIEGADLSEYKDVSSFDDVLPGRWYSSAVEWAYRNKITEGVGNNLFSPSSNVSREQTAVFLRAYAQRRGTDIERTADISNYPDASKVHSWAFDAMAWAVGNGLISGVKSGDTVTLSPLNPSSRAMVSVIIMNFDSMLKRR